MAVKTGPGAQRQTAVARSVSDLGALMSAKAEAQAQPQPDIQVQAEVSVLPESNHNLTGAASVTKEADTQSTPATAQNEQTLKEETTMAKNAIAQAEVNPALAAAPALETNSTPTAANVNASAEAPLSSSEVMGDDTTTAAPIQSHADLDKLLADATPDVNAALTAPASMVDYLQGRDSRFKTLVAVTKDTVSRVDALEAKFVELSKNGITKSSTLTVKSPDWKDQVVDGLLVGSATAIGVFGIAYAFDALFGQPGAAESGEPAIQ